jgi:tetratricopeptide (TPR) repeat protein
MPIRTIIEPFRIKSVEPIHRTTRAVAQRSAPPSAARIRQILHGLFPFPALQFLSFTRLSPGEPNLTDDAQLKIFLSHSTRDSAFVHRLADAIRGAGHIPWLCEVDIDKADNIVEKMEEGLSKCDLALLVWSCNAAASKWTHAEWTSVRHREVTEHRLRLGIIRLDDEPLPQLLRNSKYIDARRDPDAALRETVEWLEHRHAARRMSGPNAPIFLPEYRPADFVGRGTYLDRLSAVLTAEPSTFLLHGEPGAGKSTLALEFAWQAQKDFDAVIFLACGNRPLDAITADLIERLLPDAKTLPPEDQRQAAKAWLRSGQSLLVLDDVRSPDLCRLEPGPPCSVLYTSRLKSLPGIPATRSEEVKQFTEPEAESLFHLALDPVFGAEEVARHREALLAFAATVEFLPLAVAVGASLLREQLATPLSKGAARLRPERLTDGIRSVPELFQKAIESRPEPERKLLSAAAICLQEDFWLPYAAQIAELSGLEAEEAANRLAGASLLRVLDRDRSRFQLHALLRAGALARLDTGAVAQLLLRQASVLESLFREWQTRWPDCREPLPEIVPPTKFLWQQGQRQRTASLASDASQLSHRIGELDAAFRTLRHLEPVLTEALALLKKQEATCLELGNKDGLQVSYGNQALILQAWGRREEALTLLKKKEAICLELGNKSGLAHCYWKLGLLAKAQADPKVAREKLEEALAIFTELKMPRERDAVRHALDDLGAA